MSEGYKTLPEAIEILECKKKRPLSTFEFGFMRGCEYAYEHQQAKVEGLQQELESERAETIKCYSKISDLRLERDKLQKRVDQAEKLIQKWNGGGYDIFDVFKQIEQALKGEG